MFKNKFSRWAKFGLYSVAKYIAIYPLSFLSEQMRTYSAFHSPKGAILTYWESSAECIKKNYEFPQKRVINFWKGAPLATITSSVRLIFSMLYAQIPPLLFSKDQFLLPFTPDPPTEKYTPLNAVVYGITYPLEIAHRRSCQKDSVDTSLWSVIKRSWTNSSSLLFFLPSTEILLALGIGVARVYLTGLIEPQITKVLFSQFQSALKLFYSAILQATPPTTYLSFGFSPLVPPMVWSAEVGGFSIDQTNFFRNESLWYLAADSALVLS